MRYGELQFIGTRNKKKQLVGEREFSVFSLLYQSDVALGGIKRRLAYYDQLTSRAAAAIFSSSFDMFVYFFACLRNSINNHFVSLLLACKNAKLSFKSSEKFWRDPFNAIIYIE